MTIQEAIQDNGQNLILKTNDEWCNGHQHCADAHREKSHLIKLSSKYQITLHLSNYKIILQIILLPGCSNPHLLEHNPVSILANQRQVRDEAEDEAADQ